MNLENFKNINTSFAEKINDFSVIYKNFVSQEICESIVNKMKNFELKSGKGRFPSRLIWGPESEHLDEGDQIINSISSLLSNGLVCDGLSFINVPKGSNWHEHTDSMGYSGEGNAKVYGGVIYLNNFDGGSLYYPESGTEVYPKIGDMVIHTVDVWHGTRITESENRFILTFLIWIK